MAPIRLSFHQHSCHGSLRSINLMISTRGGRSQVCFSFFSVYRALIRLSKRGAVPWGQPLSLSFAGGRRGYLAAGRVSGAGVAVSVAAPLS